MDIKIRGWHVQQKKMYSAEEMAANQLTLLPTGKFINVSGDDTQKSKIFSKDEFIPLLYTSMDDEKGKEIYAGHILRSMDGAFEEDQEVIITEVRWLAPQLAWACYERIMCKGVKMECMRELLCDIEHPYIIGNIYENPELLK